MWKSVDLKKSHQMKVVKAALKMLRHQRGILLADEVGMGKTFEALGICASNLYESNNDKKRRHYRVLILVPSGLRGKWRDDMKEKFKDMIKKDREDILSQIKKLVSTPTVIRGKNDLYSIESIKNGFYICSPNLFFADSIHSRTPSEIRQLNRLRHANWDIIVIDEAHEYRHETTRRFKLFLVKKGMPNGETEFEAPLKSKVILALTATPFHLEPAEMVNLLRIVGAAEDDAEHIKELLSDYQKKIAELMRLGRGDLRSKQIYRQIVRLKNRPEGLQETMRRFIIRNLKKEKLRNWYLRWDPVNPVEIDRKQHISMQTIERGALTLSDADKVYYLSARNAILLSERRMFLSMLQQMSLSSYSALENSCIKNGQVLAYVVKPSMHPKITKLHQLLETLSVGYAAETSKDVRIKKILVFCKYRKTLAELASKSGKKTGYLLKFYEPMFRDLIEQKLQRMGSKEKYQDFRKSLKSAIRKIIDQLLYGKKWSSKKKRDEKILNRYRPLLDITIAPKRIYRGRRESDFLTSLRAAITKKLLEELRILRLLGMLQNGPAVNASNTLESILKHEIQKLAFCRKKLDSITKSNGREQKNNASELVRELLAFKLVDKIEGATPSADRTLIAKAFNDENNPYVLVCSEVGEQGIDLQKCCNDIVHYDLEWNPSKMEQREGRVDREDRGELKNDHIRVHIPLLKGTYDERMFHDVEQRRLWFDLLIGSAGKRFDEVKQDTVQEPKYELTPQDRQRLLIDLRPR